MIILENSGYMYRRSCHFSSISDGYLRKIVYRSLFVWLNINPILRESTYCQKGKKLEQVKKRHWTGRCLHGDSYLIESADGKWISTRSEGATGGAVLGTAVPEGGAVIP